MLYLIVLSYIILVILTYGILYADFTRRFPSLDCAREDMGTAILFALFSPISTIIAFLITGFARYGLRFK